MSRRFSFSYFFCCDLGLLNVLLLFHICLCDKKSDNALCIEAEKQALLVFKHGLIDEANRLASWVVEDKDCCRWAGIACDNSTGHVQRIHLPGRDGNCNLAYYYTDVEYKEASKQRLKGDISPSLLELKQLEHLDLSCNDFGGIQVPKFIGSLQNLRYLNLSNSIFGGIIPPQLGNLTELRVLSVGSFYNQGESRSTMNIQWLSSLGMLHHLDLSGVDLSKATDWLKVINTLPSLVQLHLPNCNLLDIDPYVPSLNLTSLSLLDLSFNNFDSYMPKWIFSITTLVSLDVSMCSFHGAYPGSVANFGNMTSLESLLVRGNSFMNSSLILAKLSSSNLISLEISYCGISSSDLDSVHNLTSLLSLDVSGNQLTKRIPKSLGNLCTLRDLYFSSNNLGDINLTYLLESFLECKSPALESLYLSGNYINGIIPPSIGKLSFLRTLHLGGNQIFGSIPNSIGRLSSLEVLSLSFNQLNGSIPGWIRRLSSLKELYLSHNRLCGNLPDSLGQLSKLVTLDFSYNLLTGVVTEAHFAKLVSLKRLIGTRNNLTLRLQVANWISPFQIEELHLNSWVLGPQFPMWLHSQKDLMYLDISNTSISLHMPETFVRSFPNLHYLNMSHNQIQGALMFLGVTLTVELVDLSYNKFRGSLHHLLCSNGVKEARDLNLGNNHLSGVIPECFEKWPSLLFLNLENNNFSGEIPRTLGYIPSLTLLNMRGNKFSGRLANSLMNLSYLEILQLGRNKLVGRIPSWIGTKLTLLRILNLRANNFHGNIPHKLCNLRRVQILDLAHNNLSGNIPRCFNNFSILSGIDTTSTTQFSFASGSWSFIAGDSLVMKGREDTYSTILPLVMLLDLSSNNLVGHIPSELTSMRELNSLNLSRNQLDGKIPENIGDMKELISFDLSMNKLSGELPISLARLNFLTSFNVSYNNLTGRIPTSTQIQSLNESSFFGNRLCGVPLTKTDGCARVEVSGDSTKDQKEDNGADWGLIISIVLGFVTGFWIFVGTLIISRSWRIAYSRLLNSKYCCSMFSR